MQAQTRTIGLQAGKHVSHVVVRFVEELQPVLCRLGEDSGRNLEATSRDFC